MSTDYISDWVLLFFYYHFYYYFIITFFIFASFPFFFFGNTYMRRICCTTLHFRDSYTKTQEVHGWQSFARRIQLQLITFAMTFVGTPRWLVSRSRYQFLFRDSIQHGRAFPSTCCISQGNGNRFEERCCETAVGNTPSACMSPSTIGVIPLMSHSSGSTPRAFLSPSRSPKRTLFHCPRNIFTAACVMCRYFSTFLLPSAFRDRRISIVWWEAIDSQIK